jgi:hypothetical protein
MKRVAALLLVLSACSGASSSSPRLDGNWLYASSSSAEGLGLTLKSDGTYVSTVLVLTSSNSGNAQIEEGAFTTSGSTITFTPKAWSCPGPDAVYSDSYTFDGADLDLSYSGGVLLLQPNTSTASSSFSLVTGCFASDGTFTQVPLAPVSN